MENFYIKFVNKNNIHCYENCPAFIESSEEDYDIYLNISTDKYNEIYDLYRINKGKLKGCFMQYIDVDEQFIIYKCTPLKFTQKDLCLSIVDDGETFDFTDNNKIYEIEKDGISRCPLSSSDATDEEEAE